MSVGGHGGDESLKRGRLPAEGARMRKNKVFRAAVAVAMLAAVLQSFGAAIKW
jgi:hypothetical protein